MTDYRQRLQERGYIGMFEAARNRGDSKAMGAILRDAGFAPLEIESILWSKGDIGSAPTSEEKKKRIVDEIIGRVGLMIFTGLILGGIFVYFSSGLADSNGTGTDMTEVMAHDYRDPTEACHRPFLWGLVIGGIIGLAGGPQVINSLLRKLRRQSDSDVPR